MRIVIAGAGKLGFSIAQLLANDSYDVVVIEIDDERRETVQNTLDVLAVSGNSCNPSTLEDPNISNADIMIACTNSDEVNMITCLMAKKYGIKNTVARIRDTEYAITAKEMLLKDMKIDLVINPERITAIEIERILMTPSALNVDDFAGGRVRMFEAKIKEDSPYINVLLKDLVLPSDILITMVFRKNKMIIPRGNDMLLPEDNVYFVGKVEAIKSLENQFSKTYEKLERVLIIGAGRTGRFLTTRLDNTGVQVKVIEKDKERCHALSRIVNNAMILCGDGTDIDLLQDEGISEADVVICLTEDDKLNLMLAQLAKHLGAKKTIVRVARNEYIGLMEKVGVDTVLSSRLLSADEVLQFVRRGNVVSVSLLEGAKAEALELIVGRNSDVDGRLLRHIGLPQESLLCAVVRGGEVIIPNGNTELRENDRVILFIKSELAKSTVTIFESRG